MALRVFAVLAAVFLITSVALASMLPADQPLSQIMAGMDASYLPRLQSFELSRLGGWAWQGLTVPLLVRPIWLAPFALGVLCLGAVTTINWRVNSPRPRRRSF